MDASCDLSKTIDNAKRQSTLDEQSRATEGQTQSAHLLTTSLCCPQEGAVLYTVQGLFKPNTNIYINTINMTQLKIKKTKSV